jgi:hypothetical protein
MDGNVEDPNQGCLRTLHQALKLDRCGPTVGNRHNELGPEDLDFSIESLEAVDRFLLGLHDQKALSERQPLRPLLWAVAVYVGEVIRRQARVGHYEWIAIGENERTKATIRAADHDLLLVPALHSRNGHLCLPTRAVLRITLRGQKARSVGSFARGAIESSIESRTELLGHQSAHAQVI